MHPCAWLRQHDKAHEHAPVRKEIEGRSFTLSLSIANLSMASEYKPTPFVRSNALNTFFASAAFAPSIRPKLKGAATAIARPRPKTRKAA